MAEGVASAATGQVVAEPVYDNPDAPPPPDPQQAPKGWTWSRTGKRWVARARYAAGLTPPPPPPEPTAAPQQQTAPGRDPDPGWMAEGAPAAPAVWDAASVPAAVKDDIAGMLALLYSIPADFLITVDPFCFGALNENLAATVDATVPIICRSKTAVEFITGASGLILWIKLAATLRPFLVAVWQHHVIHSVSLAAETDEATGEATGRVTVQRQDYSAYTAA
jgi:hypothetical protein